MSKFLSYLFFWIHLSEVRAIRRVLNSEYIRNDERLKMYTQEVMSLTVKSNGAMPSDDADRVSDLARELLTLGARQTAILKELDGRRLYLI